MSSPELEKKKSKKRKKEKDSADSSSKKRRKEPTDEAAIVPETDTPKRKHKRHTETQADDATTSPAQTQDSNKKKHKKRKEKQPLDSSTGNAVSDELLRTHSPFLTQTTSFYLALSPCAHNFPVEGLCAEHISPLILTYYPPLHGVVLSYSNARVSEHPTDAVQVKSSDDAIQVLARSINEYAVTYVWLTADFVLFRPQRGKWLEGYVSLQNESLLGLMCYNYFNAIIPREKLPENWKWESETDWQGGSSWKKSHSLNDESGYFVDGDGNKVEGRIIFQVDDFDATPSLDGVGGTVSISGTLRPLDTNET